MTVPANGNMLLAGGEEGGYQISKSVRLRRSNSAYLNRTFSSSANRKTWTFSCWFKRGMLIDGGGDFPLFSAQATSYYDSIRLNGDATFHVYYDGGFGASTAISANPVFRDPSAWMHLVVSQDTTQATEANRLKIWINGVQQTLTGIPAQNYQSGFNNSVAHHIGKQYSQSEYWDGYITETYFIDGQALTNTSFGEFDAITNVWNPKKYAGTYGTNGFYLKFDDTSSFGKDSSGNSNTWTSNNISNTAGSTYDSMVDVPTNYGTDTGVGGTVRGNYPTFNPLQLTTNGGTQATLSGGNLTATFTASDYCYVPTTLGADDTNPMYCEFYINNIGAYSYGVGILSFTPGTAGGTGIWRSDGSASQGISGQTFTTGDLIGIAISGGTATAYKNGSLVGTISSANYRRYVVIVLQGNGASVTVNFGQRPFAYTAPSGYKALCTQNLPTPTILNGANHMAATLYTGTGASQNISNAVNGISFQPDLVWIKNRSSGSTSHTLYNTVVGISTFLQSNTSDSSFGNAGMSPINTDGFGTFSTNSWNNASGSNYVGWQWKASGSTVSNTAGSITSTVSASTTAGFSVLKYTGTGSNATVGHGLGVAPNMVITKRRDAADGWVTYHTSLTSGAYILSLQSTGAQASNATVYNSMTTRSSTVYSVGTDTSTNASGGTYVAYCFAAISGYSAFGSYTGNGSGDGPFIYLGFRPRWWMHKNYGASGDGWWVYDSVRNTYNALNFLIQANLSNAEVTQTGTGIPMDFVANGVKIRNASGDGSINGSGSTYIYAAFAENPFNISRAR